ncbi:Cys-tRNA(Pro)/Cys-tRNA(Cys) deacylase ybaK [Gluconacetobacter sp. SXCC-1]|uniref:aminoacyl-tRNA deacylase n=1 Tax=Komagataeibacter rhaeticus TaxID=215221 RepID=UPI00020804FF|nr:aminoacyl-tRNA deacylase [Komagataeibacter rhaeticus]ATU72960.1 aminoacyl-tRNA deacylase [Komagataeibacter xylinus]EGG77266.1 Cys-tRNA(Pro)/Cys-tRNA(Cys) deacylase ybaK [Gluconacetobacter sp. SXCC-1]WPP22767.1 aminoacyl-tRNA deacylase [Komagataeibacter rhaeticus]
MTGQTSATRFLARHGVPFSVHDYDYAPGGGLIGMQAASSIGADPACVLKTLVVEVDRATPVCLVVPADHKVNFKKVAALFGGRNARMMAPERSMELTGFRAGGTSPFGQATPLPVVLSDAAMGLPHVYVNAGERGLVVRIAPADARAVVDARVADISAPAIPAPPAP